ncbi:MAG: hypothetical protein JWL81_354 [Verrucomicrobiales bacterium]|nr:hypothetical protein [Verrucomicrobiales bacterium]
MDVMSNLRHFFRRYFRAWRLACLLLIPASASAQAILTNTPEVVEGDGTAVNAAFHYSIPTLADGASVEFSLLSQNQEVGKDYPPYRAVVPSAPGGGLSGSLQVPVAGDLEPESTGNMTLIMRRPEAADWAASLSAPVNVPMFNQATGGGKLIYWKDDLVAGARLSTTDFQSSLLDLYQRGADGGLTLRATLTSADSSFIYGSVAVTPQLVVTCFDGKLRTWYRGTDNPWQWTEKAVLNLPSAIRMVLQKDRLFIDSESGSLIFRQDPAASPPWRFTSASGVGTPWDTGEDFTLTFGYQKVWVGERQAGTEDSWRFVYEVASVKPQPSAWGAGKGIFVMEGATGLEIHERSASGVWGKVGELPVVPLPSSQLGAKMTVAISGDWIAVGEGYEFAPAPQGTVRLFLRNAVNRSTWDAVGTLTGPGQGYGRQLFWNGPELVSSCYPGLDEFFVVSRRFEGATAVLQDNDAGKLALQTYAAPEPVGSSETVECFAELLLPTTAPVTIQYQLVSGTAQAGTDFAAASGTVVIPAGASRVAIPVMLLGDALLEPEEIFQIELTTAGQAHVIGTMRIRDSNSPSVLVPTPTPLLEGMSPATVAVKQVPTQGGSLPVDPHTVQARFGGFTNPAASPPRATSGSDLTPSNFTLSLPANGADASYQVSATQDSILEPSDELTSSVFSGLTRERECSNLGIAYEGPMPTPPAEITGTTSTYGVVAAGEWVFAVHAGAHVAGGSSTHMVGCYQWAADGSPALVPVQFIPIEQGTGFTNLHSDGRTLAIMSPRVEGENTVGYIRVFEIGGPPAAPWQQVMEWKRGYSNISNTLVVDGDTIFMNQSIMERTGGHYRWRSSDTVETVSFDVVGLAAAQAGFFVVEGPAYGEVILYGRRYSGPRAWVKVSSFLRSHDGTAVGFGRAYLRGRSLFLINGYTQLEIYRRSAAGAWAWEQTLPAVSGPSGGYYHPLGESTLEWGGSIHSRIGAGSLPWVVSGQIPVFLPNEEVKSVGGVLAGVNNNILSILRPGLPMAISDDDSLQFTLEAVPIGSAPGGMEPASGEAVARLVLRASHPSPIPFNLRVRSRDSGSAVAGLDYAPVDFVLPVPTIGATAPYYTEFPVRIFSDRLLEGLETFELLLESAPFGNAVPVTVMNIIDTYPSGLKQAETAPTVFESAAGNRVQTVDFLFSRAFNNDLQFTPSIDSGGTAILGQDFALPAGDVVLKAGENRLRVPITVMADAADEIRETFFLRVTANPALAGFSLKAEVGIIDATVPGLLADEGYALDQGTTLTADGVGANPTGTAANDPAPGPGSYALFSPPTWGTVTMQPDGSFSAVPGPNVAGKVSFSYQVVAVPFQRFLDASAPWKYLHPTNGVNPATGNPSFTSTWATVGFDDSAWTSGTGTIAYGGFEIPALPGLVNLTAPGSGSRYTDYFRTSFVSAAAVTVPLKLSLYCDDGVVIYINGVERGRAQSVTTTTFASAPDTYTLVTGGSQDAVQEGTLRTVNLGNVPLLTGNNTLAISLHNISATSSDLGIRLVSLETGLISDPVPVTLTVAPVNAPLVAVPDNFTCPQSIEFVSSDNYGASFLDNDGLITPDGSAYDPVLEIVASPVSAGSLTLVGTTGHFRYTPPVDFAGQAWFDYQLRDKDGLSQPVRVTLNVQPALPFDLWRSEALSATSPADGDPDRDGLNTFLEYTLGSNPSSGALASAHGFTPSPGGGGLSLMVRRAADLAWRIEVAESPDAASWTVLKVVRGLEYQSPVSREVVIRSTAADSMVLDIVPPASTAVGRKFYRLRSQRIPF